MSFTELQGFSDGPERQCPDRFGGLLAVFPAKVLEGHERLGYNFRPNACLDTLAYDPDVCAPGDLKMTPGTYDPAIEAILGMLQTAIVCSTVGATMDELREEARRALSDNLERAIEADFIAFLDTNDTPQGGPVQAKCALADAAQYLTNSSECGRGLIVGPVDWFIQLEDLLIWNGKYHTDFVGNIVIPHSVDNSTVYALDMAVDIKVSEVLLLDELAPGVTTVNDRVVRAEQLYTVAVDSCEIGSFTVSACCPCATGGGGGGTGGDVNIVSSIPLDVNVLNPSAPVNTVDDECLQDDNGVFFRRVVDDGLGNLTVSTVDVAGNPYIPVGTVVACNGEQPTVRTMHKMATDANPWTLAGDAPGAIITAITYTVISGTVNVTASNGQIVAGIPAGLSASWTNDTEGVLQSLLSITPQGIGDRAYVNWTERV